jgi:hypothetical protein
MDEFQDLEALWSVVFLTPNSTRLNAGVVVFETNRIFGGDSWYYYTGTYQGKGGKLTAKIRSTHYFGEIGSPAIGTLPQGIIEFVEVSRGKDSAGRRTIRIEGTVVDPPTALKVVAELTWRAGLDG